MSENPLSREIDAAMTPMRASLAPWGVVSCRWLGEVDGAATVEVRTRTEIERVALQSQPWLLSQIEILLARLSVPRHVVHQLQLRFVSEESGSATE